MHSVSDFPTLNWETIVVNWGVCCHSQLFLSQDGARSPRLSPPGEMRNNMHPCPVHLQENSRKIPRSIRCRTSSVHRPIPNICNQNIAPPLPTTQRIRRHHLRLPRLLLPHPQQLIISVVNHKKDYKYNITWYKSTWSEYLNYI